MVSFLLLDHFEGIDSKAHGWRLKNREEIEMTFLDVDARHRNDRKYRNIKEEQRPIDRCPSLPASHWISILVHLLLLSLLFCVPRLLVFAIDFFRTLDAHSPGFLWTARNARVYSVATVASAAVILPGSAMYMVLCRMVILSQLC